MVAALFAGLLLAVAGCGIAAAVLGRGVARLPQVTMALGMAVMFLPGGWPGAAARAVCFLVPAVLALRLRAHRAHVVVGSAAMAYACTLPGMAGGMSGMFMAPGGVRTWVDALLVGYFLVEAGWTGRGLLAAAADDGGAVGGGAFVASVELETGCAMVTAVAMGYMFLSAI